MFALWTVAHVKLKTSAFVDIFRNLAAGSRKQMTVHRYFSIASARASCCCMILCLTWERKEGGTANFFHYLSTGHASGSKSTKLRGMPTRLWCAICLEVALGAGFEINVAAFAFPVY